MMGRGVVADAGCRFFFWGVRDSGLVRKRIRLNRKPPAHLAGLAVQSRPRVWKRLHPVEFLGDFFSDHQRRRRDQDIEGLIPAQARTGVG